MSGDILADTLDAAGYKLDGEMLSGEAFEAVQEWGKVSDVAHDLAHRFRELSRLTPDLEIGFSSGPVHEYDQNGNEVHCHHKIYAQGAVTLSLGGMVAAIGHGGPALTAEEQAAIERLARIQKAAELARAVINCDQVLTVLRLLDGEPGAHQLGSAFELIQDDMNGDLSAFAPPKQFTRFNRSINHPQVFGVYQSRHAVARQQPPSDPMDIDEAIRFIKGVSQKWITEKAAMRPPASPER